MNKIIDIARQRFEDSEEQDGEWRDQAEEDLRFFNGEQWPEDILRDRQADNRPALVINRVPSFVRQVVNDIRQTRPAIKVRGVDSGSDPRTAEVMNGLIRAIEQTSNAEAAYDWAAEHAVKTGRGYFRVKTEYETETGFEQGIRIERIHNQLTIYDDPDAQQADASDRRYCFIVEQRDRKRFEEQYGKVDDWSSGDDWATDDKVRVAEYWSIEEQEKTLTLMSDGSVVEGDVPKDMAAELLANGYPTPVTTRKTKDRKVISRLITGSKVLEESVWPGKYIPIVRVLGEESIIEGKPVYRGMIADMKDPQRQYNYMRSASVERIALAPKAPWVGPVGSFKDPKWRRSNTKNYPYLEYEPVSLGDRPQRDPPPEVSSGLVTEVQHSAEELKAVTGIYNPGLGDRSNEVSGVAINSRRSESDVSNFHFMDNLARAIRYTGKILVDLIPKIYTPGRAMTILGVDGSEERVTLGMPQMNKGKMEIIDLNAGRYDVVVDVGPSYATQRQEAVESMLEIAKAFPQSVEVMGDLMAKNMDWPEADEIAKRLKTLLPPEILAGESPQIAAMLKRHEQEKQQMMQIGEQMQRQIEQLQNELQKEQQKRAIDLAKIREDARQADLDHTVEMTELELEARRDLNNAGVAY